jgi:hypothetical protein
MAKGTSYKYIATGDSWRTELLLVFIAGFVLATALWLGLWFVHAKPAQADNLQSCLTEKSELTALRAKVATEKEKAAEELAEAKDKLDEALVGWGRCIRSQSQTKQETEEAASALRPTARQPRGYTCDHLAKSRGELCLQEEALNCHS